MRRSTVGRPEGFAQFGFARQFAARNLRLLAVKLLAVRGSVYPAEQRNSLT